MKPFHRDDADAGGEVDIGSALRGY